MISVIIPTYNERALISEAIESLDKQSIKDFEIIVVDDGSVDGSLEILRKLTKPYSRLKFYRQNHKGAGAARNLGVKKAKGSILVFIDADMTFENNFLKNLTRPILEGKSKGTWSKDEYVKNWDNIWARCWNIEEGWADKKRHPGKYPDTQTVFRAILKSEFERVGGFTPGGYDDDWSLYKKLGYKAENSKNAIFYHENPSTLQEIYHQAKWVGKRKYKYGYIGVIYTLLKTAFPISLITAISKSLKNNNPHFIIFKLVYDFGRFVGLLQFLFKKNLTK